MLKVSNIRKQYSSVLAADNVSLEARRGAILGLIGPNGAGKTTTIRMILNIIQPDSGSITYDDKPFNQGVRDIIGYLPEERGLYRKNKLLNAIMYFASLRGVPADEAKRRAYDWLKRFDLLNYYDRKIEELSKGNQQKVGFIISVLHDPQLVILDEPFSGLDPINQINLKDILLELKKLGKAIIFSTHQMDHAEKLCDDICLINSGKVILEGSLPDIKSRYGKNTIQLIYDGDGAFMHSLAGVKTAHVYENFAELVLSTSNHHNELLIELAKNINVRKFERVEPSLNAIFLELVGADKKTILKGGGSYE
ncbi:MAG TPA: ATP-binding cassette domain-containing protein [Bacteroidota bacterium]|jgi:ABC-2 type transport system ATP-binding protein|nr:ATP-binding cassette domain-containing protein [Bacteroidota bacterium]